MSEMSYARKSHRHSALIRGGDHVRIANRSSGLNRGGRARFRGRNQTIWKRKKSVATYHAALKGKLRLAGFPDGDTAGIDPAHLSRADPERPTRADINDGVRFHVLDDAPAEKHPLQLLIRRLALRDDL